MKSHEAALATKAYDHDAAQDVTSEEPKAEEEIKL